MLTNVGRPTALWEVPSDCSTHKKNLAEGRSLAFCAFGLSFAVKFICSVIVVAADSFADVRTSVSRLPFWTMDQSHSVNLPGFQHQTRTAKASSLVDGATTGLLPSPVRGQGEAIVEGLAMTTKDSSRYEMEQVSKYCYFVVFFSFLTLAFSLELLHR